MSCVCARSRRSRRRDMGRHVTKRPARTALPPRRVEPRHPGHPRIANLPAYLRRRRLSSPHARLSPRRKSDRASATRSDGEPDTPTHPRVYAAGRAWRLPGYRCRNGRLATMPRRDRAVPTAGVAITLLDVGHRNVDLEDFFCDDDAQRRIELGCAARQPWSSYPSPEQRKGRWFAGLERRVESEVPDAADSRR
jgi:hypothetical protein